MNRVCLLGRMTSNPELKYTEKNVAICNFSIAINRNYKNANGEYEADFINCVAYKNTAEIMGKYIKKGDKISIEGRIQTRKYKDKEDKNRISTVVLVEHLGFVESKKKEDKDIEEFLEVKEEKKGLSDDVFAEFGEQIQIDESDLAF